ncbi:FAD/NAD(P)-binding domain-containing protein [Xylariaceae sp. AK1471]|nr:FAD/NAD(P)-binding domain-containing protein [Xylariaceae sp. AK1471]
MATDTSGTGSSDHTPIKITNDTEHESNKIIIVGAGSTGAALAQGLKKAGIPFALYEKEASPTRERNWNMALHWGIEPLRALVPAEILGQIQSTQVDPHRPTNDMDRLPFINGQTGELIREIQSSKFYRVRRDKFRRMLLTGLDVQWGKALTTISYSDDERTVTAKFADGSSDTGSLLVGTDGPNSVVRICLVGVERARVTPIDFASTMCFTRHTREHALYLRSPPHNPLYQLAQHPDGFGAWLSLHDGDDAEHPENWTFFHYISFPEPRDHVNTRSTREHVAHQKQLAQTFADPWRSVYQWMPDDADVWYSKLRHWDPSLPEHAWNGRDGRVTLAGDAAHPMTFQRGQGLNHAVQDAFTAYKAIERFWKGGTYTVEERCEAIAEYETEMISRTGEEVRLSEASSYAVHDWAKLMQSPLMQKGLTVET